MLSVMRTVQRVPWLEQIPIVCDRAMGYNAYIFELLDADVRFITALIAPEFDSYGAELPAAKFADLPAARLRDELPQCTTQAAARATEIGELQQLSDKLFIKDLGIVNCPVTGHRFPKELGAKRGQAAENFWAWKERGYADGDRQQTKLKPQV